jgi:hypothetical protein
MSPSAKICKTRDVWTRPKSTANAYGASMSPSAKICKTRDVWTRPKSTANAYGASMPSSANTNCGNLRSFDAHRYPTFMSELKRGIIVHGRWGHRRSRGIRISEWHLQFPPFGVRVREGLQFFSRFFAKSVSVVSVSVLFFSIPH